LPKKPVLKFSHHFPGVIWNTLAVPETNLLILEVRDDKNFQVQFSALDFSSGKFAWKDLKFKETWWIGCTAANPQVILFHTYVDKATPNHKNLIAYDIFEQKIRWEVEEFSFFDWDSSVICGYRTKDELKKAIVSIDTGFVAEGDWQVGPVQDKENVLRPTQFLEGSSNFEMVKTFIQQHTKHVISKGAEYVEWRDWIMISMYVEVNGKLANYLLVFDKDGQFLMEEKLAENLTGLGADTFFILSGCLFLVKNKSELVVYSYD
jgi:hypothetical protein